MEEKNVFLEGENLQQQDRYSTQGKKNRILDGNTSNKGKNESLAGSRASENAEKSAPIQPQQKKIHSNKISYEWCKEQNGVKLEMVKGEQNKKICTYLPENLWSALRQKDIPIYYVRSLLRLNELLQVKSTRRLKVERYLQKRRKKTWDIKICYNCRQKVAEERLRIKGKFIKKRTAMQLLNITKPIRNNLLKIKLQHIFSNKTNQQIFQIIKMEEQKPLKQEFTL